jgi:hypothetical protein
MEKQKIERKCTVYKIPHKEKKERMNETTQMIETDVKRK